MIASYLCMILSAVLTVAAWNLPSLCLAMTFTALSYNLNSGTRDALTYDSLKACEEEERYLSVNSNQRFLCSAAVSLSKLATGIAGRIGYLLSYGCNMVFSGISILLISGMKEPQVTEAQKNRAKFSFATIGQELWRQLTESLLLFAAAYRHRRKNAAGCSHRLRRHSDNFLFTAAFFS